MEKNHQLLEKNRKWENSYLAIVDTKVVGFLIASLYSMGIHINRLAVVPEFQKQHIGTYLLDFFEGGVIDADISLMVSVKNTNAVRFYEKKGYRYLSNAEIKLFLQAKEIVYREICDKYFIDDLGYKDAHYVMRKRKGEQYLWEKVLFY